VIRRLWVLTGFEVRKLLARRLPLVAFLAVILVTLLAPQAGEVLDTAGSLMKGRGAEKGADDYANGWTALTGAVDSARMFLVVVLLVLSSSSVAEETGQRTLQAMFVRPLRRTEVLLAKALATWGYGVLLLLGAVGAAALGAELSLGLYDIMDPAFPARPPKHVYGDMWTYVFLATGLTLLPLASLTCLGLLTSVLFEHPGYATGVAIGGLFLLSAAGGLDQDTGSLLFVGYLSSPFELVSDLANQYTGTARRMTTEALMPAVIVPVGWAVGLFVIAATVLARRDITN
jgi:ABC-type transport system involved in multi-copper enzyme maturation permease subunit